MGYSYPLRGQNGAEWRGRRVWIWLFRNR